MRVLLSWAEFRQTELDAFTDPELGDSCYTSKHARRRTPCRRSANGHRTKPPRRTAYRRWEGLGNERIRVPRRTARSAIRGAARLRGYCGRHRRVVHL